MWRSIKSYVAAGGIVVIGAFASTGLALPPGPMTEDATPYKLADPRGLVNIQMTALVNNPERR